MTTELESTGKDVWLMGGGQCLRAFHDAGLVDEWEISIIPVFLGRGLPLFPPREAGLSMLKLNKRETYSNGVVNLTYTAIGPNNKPAQVD